MTLLLLDGVVSEAHRDFQVEAHQIQKFTKSRFLDLHLGNLSKEGLWVGRIGCRGWLVRRTVQETRRNDSGRNRRNIAMMKGQSQSGNAYEQLSILT